jgi:hypothetical protein
MKKNLVSKKKESTTTASCIRLPNDLKEKAQIYAIRKKLTLTDLIIMGLQSQIN